MKNAKIDNFGDLYSIDQSTCLHRTKYPNSTYVIDHFIHPLKCTPIAKVDAKLRRSKNKFLILDPEPIKIFLLSHTKYELIEVELLTGYSQARFKRRTLHVPNLMQMRKIYCFRSFALDSAHVKFDV